MRIWLTCTVLKIPRQTKTRIRANTTIGISALYLAQGDGGLPTTLATGSAPGENGVSVFSLRFRGGLHFSATPRQHLIWFWVAGAH